MFDDNPAIQAAYDTTIKEHLRHPERYQGLLDDALSQLWRTGKIVHSTAAGVEIVIDYNNR